MKSEKKIILKVTRANDKTLKFDYEVLTKVLDLLNGKKWARSHDWNDKEIEILNKHLLITSKPIVYLINMSEYDFIKKKSKWLPKIKQWIDENDPGAGLIPFSAVFENKLQEMETDEARKTYCTEVSATSQMDKIITTGYKTLQLAYFFTAGEDEVKCWTIQVGTKAPQAAGRIHTDFEKGFIMAEVMKYEDWKECGSEAACKAAGKYRQQGKQYTVEDGDIILFKINAGAGLGGKK